MPSTVVYHIFYDDALVGSTVYDQPIEVRTDEATGISFVYPVNESGQSYGYAPLQGPNYTDEDREYIGQHDISSQSESLCPDLIGKFHAYGTDDVIGYIKREDWFALDPKTPEEALALQDAGAFNQVFTLYSEDGETVVGEFVMGDPDIAFANKG